MNLEWYRKASKKALVSLRSKDPNARLADAQLQVARDAGYASWRALREAIAPPVAAASLDPALVKSFADALSRNRGDLDAIRSLLAAHPELANCHPWKPQWPHTAIQAAAHQCVWHRPNMTHIAALLLEHGAICDLPTVARAGSLDEVIRRLDADPTLLNQTDREGRTALYRSACTYGAFPEGRAVADELLRRGATVDIFTAASWLLVDPIKSLLARDPRLARATDPDGLTPLHWVTRSDPNDPRQVAVAQLLLDAGANPHAAAPTSEGMQPLHCAAEWPSSLPLATLLLDRGADLNARASSNLWTPLDYALDRNRTDMRDFLRSRAAKTRHELDASPDESVDKFLKLVHTGNTAKVEVALTKRPELVNLTGKHPVWGGRPQPLHIAIERDDRPMFDLLLSRGANPNGDNALYDHWSPLLLAVHWKREGMVAELAKRVDHISLIDALFMGDDDTALRLLLAGPIALQRTMPNDATLLHFATTPDATERLLDLGVSPTAKDKYGRTALDQAATRNHRDVVDVLLDHGATASPQTWATLGDLPALQNALGTTPPDPQLLITAVIARQPAIVQWLLETGIDASTRENGRSKGTALHTAAWNGDLESVNLLLAAGANPQALDAEHETTPKVWAETAFQYTGNPDCQKVIDRLATLDSRN